MYVLLDLASDAEHLPLQDYQEPVANVYRSFASAFVSQGHGPDILALASRGALDRCYPSWAPDWEQKFIGLRLDIRLASQLGDKKAPFHAQAGRCVFATEGLLVDSILWTFSRDVNLQANVQETLERLVDLVSSTTRVVQNDLERLRDISSWSSVEKHQLTLILHLFLDHDRSNVNPDTESFGTLMYSFDLSAAAHGYLKLTARSVNMITTQKAEENSHQKNVGRSSRDRGRGIWYGLLGLPLNSCSTRPIRHHKRGVDFVSMPLDVRPGDRIAIILGCRAPLGMVSSVPERRIFRRLMHGEALDDERYSVQEIGIH